MSEPNYINQVFFKDSRKMRELPDSSVQLIITSPPYFNIKDYSKDGYQQNSIGSKLKGQIGDIPEYDEPIILYEDIPEYDVSETYGDGIYW